ncbi:MAG: 6-carboxytetrahydropterin synthase QueD [Dehalococcoidia bacterium]|jgi:6-pyruvoyltetrahydropterin/6-carboxytetrahydropterin synthase
MYLLSVEKSFDAAHYLRGYKGKCEKLHGHRFKVVVRLKAEELNGIGLAYDFTDLKKDLMDILAKYDHGCLNDVEPFDKINPSSENIARTVYERLSPLYSGAAGIESIEVWESPESCAVYMPG